MGGRGVKKFYDYNFCIALSTIIAILDPCSNRCFNRRTNFIALRTLFNALVFTQFYYNQIRNIQRFVSSIGNIEKAI